jgi:exonuclease VII small subunit
MFGLASSARVKRLERHVTKLEEVIDILNLNLSSLQSAMLASSKTQEAIAYDVARVGELVSALLEAAEFGGLAGSDSGTMH